ncbi:MAG: membrane protein insertase YidC [Candidatus Omnitrophica bacterium]|nr:membrane protein insertase YidC [Candidatus Omnitrophota bacterium]
MISLAERYFCQSIKVDGSSEVEVMLYPITKDKAISVTTRALQATNDGSESVQVYFGPRDYFHLKRAGFAEAFKIGALGQVGLILLSLLKWIASITKNYGVAIIVFCAIVTAMTAPFTIISFRSMKKMQELKPRIDKLMAQHKNDSTRLNKEIFALYREHKVSPLSGCLPMLLQMPIFIALLQAISHFIELRGQTFLWIKDLSLPDRLMPLPISVPFIGADLNLLPILMAGAMFAQSKMTQASQPADVNNPAAKLMSGPLMSVLFGVMFYQFPSGLVLYWFSNSLISMGFYRLAK